jgi:hypothetical protein
MHIGCYRSNGIRMASPYGSVYLGVNLKALGMVSRFALV